MTKFLKKTISTFLAMVMSVSWVMIVNLNNVGGG